MALPLEADWKALGPFGGSLQAVARDSQEAGLVLAASASGLFFQSRDQGASWTPLSFPMQLRGTLHALLADPANGNTYFAAISSESQQDAGLLRTRDAGVTWEHLPGLRGQQVWSLATSRSTPHTLAAGTEAGLYISSDSDETWQCVTPADDHRLRPIVSVAIHPRNAGILYIGTPHLSWKTDDGGLHWSALHNGMSEDSDVFSIVVDYRQPQRLFAAACSGLYLSVNGGAGWVKLMGPEGPIGRTYFVTQHPLDARTFFAGTVTGLMQSQDGGLTWRRLLPNRARGIAFGSGRTGRILLATDDTGILQSLDKGVHFSETNQGLCARHLATLAESEGSLFTSILGGISKRGMLQLTASAGKWTTAWSDNGPVLLDPSSTPAYGNARMYTLAGESLLESTDGGRSWSRVPDAPEGLTSVFATQSAPDTIVVASKLGVFASTGQAGNWQKLALPAAAPPVRKLVPLSGRAIAALAGSQVLISRDGMEWRVARLPGSPEIYDLVANGPSGILAATSTGLMRSSDFGISWTPTCGEIASKAIQAIAKEPMREGVFYAAVNGLVYESDDNGESWQLILPEGPAIDRIIQLLPSASQPGRVFALTATRGVFVMDRAITAQ